MKLENKQELERLVHLVASGFVRCWCWNSAGSAAEECSRQWQQPAPLR